MNEEGSWIPATTDTPSSVRNSKYFGPAPPPDHPRYNPRYDHFSPPVPPTVAADDATNNTKPTIDADTDDTSDDEDDSEFYLYKGPSAPFTLRKFPKDINNGATTTAVANPSVNSAMRPPNPIILPPVFPFRHNSTTCEQFLHFEKLAVSMMIPHDSTYDDDSINSDLNYINQEGNIDKRVDSNNFVHDTEPTLNRRDLDYSCRVV